VLRHISRGDVIITPLGLQVHIKWSKTLQSYRQSAIINLPNVQGSPLSPVAAYQALLKHYPVPSKSPLLSYMVGSQLHVITRSNLQTI
jgi:hypothetical protein